MKWISYLETIHRVEVSLVRQTDEEVHKLLVEQEALSDIIIILKSADRMRLLKKDDKSWHRKFIDFMNFNERFLLNYNELDLQTSEVT